MKSIFNLVLILLSVQLCFGQLKIHQANLLSDTDDAVEAFLKANRFDYALITWSKGGRNIISHYEFSGLIKQNRKWFLVKISNPVKRIDTTRYPLSIIQKKLVKRAGDSLLKVINPGNAFSVTQEALDSLPKTCTYLKNGKEQGYYGASHSNIVCLAQSKNGKINLLQVNNPGLILEWCYPHVSQFGILRGIVHTDSAMAAATQREYLLEK